MKVNGLGLASEEMNHVKIYYMSQSWEEENLDSASVYTFLGCSVAAVRGQAGLSWANPTVWFTEEGSCLQEICNLIFQTIRPTSTFPSRLPDVCLVLDLAGWPWVFISFLTTTALFGHFMFYTSPKMGTSAEEKGLESHRKLNNG